MIYKWKTNFYKVDAETAGAVFDKLDKTVGLTAKTVVDASRPEDAPLHGEFEWDDEVAGELWREHEARRMITNLVITIEESEETPATRAFVKVMDSSPKYESIRTVLLDVEKTNSYFQTALKELESFRRKYADLKEFASLFDEIDKFVSSIKVA